MWRITRILNYCCYRSYSIIGMPYMCLCSASPDDGNSGDWSQRPSGCGGTRWWMGGRKLVEPASNESCQSNPCPLCLQGGYPMHCNMCFYLKDGSRMTCMCNTPKFFFEVLWYATAPFSWRKFRSDSVSMPKGDICRSSELLQCLCIINNIWKLNDAHSDEK